MMSDYAYYSKDPTLWEEASQALWGDHDICTLLPQFVVTLITRWEISALSRNEAHGDPKKPRFGMAYLLLVLAQEAEEERKFGLVAVWVHPCQALLPNQTRSQKSSPYLLIPERTGPMLLCGYVRTLGMSPSPMLGTTVSW